jgi:hypothetical protein
MDSHSAAVPGIKIAGSVFVKSNLIDENGDLNLCVFRGD